MKKLAVLLAILIMGGLSPARAQEVYFGKNKVQYRQFEWDYIQSDHFDIHFYDGQYELAKFAADELEKAYEIVSDQLKYYVSARIPVFIYNCHNDFQQTNIISSEPSEGTQGFTEAFKKRMVVHFMGSYESFRHLLHHELTHAVVYDMLYGEFFKAMLNPSRLFQQPLWLAEGFAEYSSNGGWTQEADMMVRDATINGYLMPPDYMGGLSYTEGFALVKYIADKYGAEKIGDIFRRGKALTSIDKTMKASLGITLEDLFKDFTKEMKKRYWPEIALRQEAHEFAQQLTDHTKDNSNYNEKPAFHPGGQMLAMFTNRSGYTEIYLISATDGKKITGLVKGQRSSDLESLHWYYSGMSFSPDGENMVFVAKSKGSDALNFLRLKDKNIYQRSDFGLKSIISPVWSPDGSRIAFTALNGNQRDLYLYNMETEEVRRLTNDLYDDTDIDWFPDGERMVFSSDRPHPDHGDLLGDGSADYGYYSLHEIDITTGKTTPLPVGEGQNIQPKVSPDSNVIAFVSNRNGTNNIYLYYPEHQRVAAITNCLTNAESPSWSPDGKKIAFSTYQNTGFDIFLIKDIEYKGDNGVLPATGFVKGHYDNPEYEWGRDSDNGRLVLPPEFDSSAQVDSELPQLFDPDAPRRQRPDSTLMETADDAGSAAGAESSASEKEETKADSAAYDPDDEQYVYQAPSGTAGSDKDDGKKEGEEEERPEQMVFAPEDEEVDLDAGPMPPWVVHIEPVDSINADDLDNRFPDGEYKIKKYHTRFTPDLITGGLNYDSFYGFQGQTVFVLSDYLGDHQFYIATDLVNTIDQSDVQAYYFYNKLRIDFGMGVFHSKYYYVDANDELFSDRFYGFSGYIVWPRSKFTRLELSGAMLFVDRRYYETEELEKRNDRVSTASLSWTHDSVLWGITGPEKGRRFKLRMEGAYPVFGTDSIKYYAGTIDYRQYISLAPRYTIAVRLSSGFSNGPNRKNFYLGGNTNRIGSINVDQDVYEVENLYFSTIVTPLRGYDYYELRGNRYAVFNLEFRYPFIEYFITRFPLMLGLTRVTGALFLDMGAAWDSGEKGFKGATSEGNSRLIGIKSGFGFGARANLGFLVLRYDMAWRTNFATVEPHTKHYFSIGADF